MSEVIDALDVAETRNCNAAADSIRQATYRGLAVLSVLILVHGLAQATMTNLAATLNGAQETPPNASTATGTGTFVLDTVAHTLSYNITFSGLSAAESGAHIHGYVGPGVAAAVVFSFPSSGSPKVGAWTGLSAAQETNILAGLTYANIHTGAFPSGEIRGQILVVPPPNTPTVTQTGTMTATPTATATPTTAMHDSVVLLLRPLNVMITKPMPITKKVRVTVRNADAAEVPGHTIVLGQSNDCPAGISVGSPDFAPPAAQTSILVPGGKTKMAVVPVTIDPGVLVTFNGKAPNRCTLTFTAGTDVTNVDPNPNNDVAKMELNVTDKTDIPGSGVHESVLKSVAPLALSIGAMSPGASRKALPTVVNADAEMSSDSIALVVDSTTCPGGVVGDPDFVPTNAVPDPSVSLAGGKLKGARLSLTFLPGTFLTPNKFSPARCTVTLKATGPTDPDPAPSNNTSTLTLDVVDKHDVP